MTGKEMILKVFKATQPEKEKYDYNRAIAVGVMHHCVLFSCFVESQTLTIIPTAGDSV